MNYFAQGMYSASLDELKWFGENVIVRGWKLKNHIQARENYPSPNPSEGTMYWFNQGYDKYVALKQRYDALVAAFPGAPDR